MLKENWYTSSYLTVTDKEIINFYNLLSMNKICHITLLIDSSIKVSRTSLTIRSSWDQNIAYLSALNKNFKTIDIALYCRKAPLFLNFIFFKFDKESFIPGKSVFYTHLLMLKRLSKIVLVRKIEAIPEDFIKLSDFLENLFFLWFEWKFSVA